MIMLNYHHCRDLAGVVYGKIKAEPKYIDSDNEGPYSWLEKEVGFYPLFLAVGTTDEDIRMTGYQDQWTKVVGSKIVGRRNDGTYTQRNILRKKGEFPNTVLFSFETVDDGVFMDFQYWHLVINAKSRNYTITDYEKRLIFKPSWYESNWLRESKKDPGSVQLVTSELYLPNASRIWVRNKETKNLLEDMGFENVEVKRLLLTN